MTKIILKVFFCLFIFCLGYILGKRSYTETASHQTNISCQYDGTVVELCPQVAVPLPDTGAEKSDDKMQALFRERYYQLVCVFDTEQKVRDYYRHMARAYFARERVLPTREWLTLLSRERPLVTTGPFAIFVDDDGIFSVRELSFAHHLVLLRSQEQYKHLRLFSLPEKGWFSQRFSVDLFYSEDGIYEWGYFAVFDEDKTRRRAYYDTQGIGVFDVMEVYENGTWHTYHLNGLTWERVDEGE